MIDTKKSGYLVETKAGNLGRTKHEKGIINGKIPVYIATKLSEEKHGIRIPLEFSEQAILCDPKNIKQIGFID